MRVSLRRRRVSSGRSVCPSCAGVVSTIAIGRRARDRHAQRNRRAPAARHVRRGRPPDPDAGDRTWSGSARADRDDRRVARDTDTWYLSERRGGVVYAPIEQQFDPFITVTARAARDTAAAVGALQAAIRRADPDVAVEAVGSGRAMLSGPYAFLRFLGLARCAERLRFCRSRAVLPALLECDRTHHCISLAKASSRSPARRGRGRDRPRHRGGRALRDGRAEAVRLAHAACRRPRVGQQGHRPCGDQRHHHSRHGAGLRPLAVAAPRTVVPDRLPASRSSETRGRRSDPRGT